MILELLKLRILLTERRIAATENKMVKLYKRRENLGESCKTISKMGEKPLSIDDIKTMLGNDQSVRLIVDGKQTLLIPNAAGAPATVEAAAAEVPVEVLVVPEPTEELMAEVENSFSDISFTVDEATDIATGKFKTKTVTRLTAGDLPCNSDQLTLSHIRILDDEDSDATVMSGIFIESAKFNGCGDPDCEGCNDDEDDENEVSDAKNTVFVRIIPDGSVDRSIVLIRVESTFDVEVSS